MCDIDIEQFVKENREKIEEILKAQKEKNTETEETLKGVFATLMKPEIQRHFLRAGIEVLSGIEAMLRNVPMSDEMKEKAHKAKETFVKEVMCEIRPGCKKTSNKKMKKIDVE